MASQFLGAYWMNRRLTLRHYIAATRHYLLELQKLHPMFHELVAWGGTAKSRVELRPGLSNLEDAIHRLGRDKDSLYTHLLPDGGLSPESECEGGFLMVYSNDKPLEEGRIQLRITAGVSSPWLSNSVVLDQRVAHASELFDPKLVKRLMGVTVEGWKPQRGLVADQEFVEKVDPESEEWSVGWLTYLANPAARLALPPGVEPETLDEGVLISLMREPPSADNPAHVELARRLKESLVARGLLT
ncbi:hypothetical protein F0U59_23590 [Archangium gephyra]|nr:hypothetical protein F0U59_23590 [Archangium gephyra]